jgi:hypothetical protein
VSYSYSVSVRASTLRLPPELLTMHRGLLVYAPLRFRLLVYAALRVRLLVYAALRVRLLVNAALRLAGILH